jgi:NAD(P)-dependent dehydrogenase (short-subunit alcohol dehydrogenase family)
MQNQTVVVLGGSSGIGLAVAQAASKLGAKVVICSRSAEKLEQSRQTIQGDVEAIAFDMTDLTSVNQAFEQIGSLDHLVATAVADENKKRGRFTDLDRETAHSSFDKFWGYFHAAQAAVPRIKPGGSVTLLSGASAFKPPSSGMSVLASVNGAIATLGRALAIELAPIRVNVVSPGAVDTPVWDEQQRNSLVKWMQESLPVQHVGTPEDIAQSVIYCMTNRYTTGVILHVDGGLMLM